MSEIDVVGAIDGSSLADGLLEAVAPTMGIVACSGVGNALSETVFTGREKVYNAIFLLLKEIAILKTCTRRLKHWKDVGFEDTPAMFMEHTGESHVPSKGLPSKVILEVNLWLYVKTDGFEVGPTLNPILDIICNKFVPVHGEYLSLGGLVHHCWIEGQLQIFEGDLGEEAVALIPVKLLVT